MSLLRTSVFNGIAVAVKVGSSLVLNKILALYVGPSGYAVIGQFQNIVSVAVSLAGGVIAPGVTKATAEHTANPAMQHDVWRSASRLSLITSIVIGIIVALSADGLTASLFGEQNMRSIFFWLAIALPSMAINNLLIAISNGKKELGTYVTANIVGSISNVVVTALLASTMGVYGALLAFAINPAVTIVTTMFLVTRRDWFRLSFLWGAINREAVRSLGGFAIMGLASALVIPITNMLIRQSIAETLGVENAGYWQAIWKISETYLLLITSTLTAYYLPRLGEINLGGELKNEIFKIYRFLLPLAVISALAIYLARHLIVTTLFTANFSPMEELFIWQLTGDVVKTGAWVCGYVMLGRSMVKAFICSEIVFGLSLAFFTGVFVRHFGLQGAGMAYALNYLVYWIFCAFLVRFELRNMTQAGRVPELKR